MENVRQTQWQEEPTPRRNPKRCRDPPSFECIERERKQTSTKNRRLNSSGRRREFAHSEGTQGMPGELESRLPNDKCQVDHEFHLKPLRSLEGRVLYLQGLILRDTVSPTSGEGFTCPIKNCAKKFVELGRLHRHFRRRNDIKHLVFAEAIDQKYCAECNREFANNEQLARHRTRDHNAPFKSPALALAHEIHNRRRLPANYEKDSVLEDCTGSSERGNNSKDGDGLSALGGVVESLNDDHSNNSLPTSEIIFSGNNYETQHGLYNSAADTSFDPAWDFWFSEGDQFFDNNYSGFGTADQHVTVGGDALSWPRASDVNGTSCSE